MTYQQTLAFLYGKLPMFTRIGAAALKKDLSNTISLCNAIDNPQNKFKSIHVAGTNGKGSTSHMLAAILQQSGYKTGLYTSPHLKDFRERIKINGKMISKSDVTKFIQRQKQTIQTIEPSFFEVTVAMAFDYFAKEKVDIAVIEVGLGGRLDSTNIITPELSIITNISLDHTAILGNTVSEIAKEKAGIIKSNIPVVVGEQQEESNAVFIEKAQEEFAPLTFADAGFKTKDINSREGSLVIDVEKNAKVLYPSLTLDLTGSYQKKNILTVLEAVEQLRQKGYLIPNQDVYAALKNTKKLTGLNGRWQILGRKPLIICDTGHNESGITEVVKNIRSTTYKNLHFVIGMVKDKDINNVLKLLPKDAFYYYCAPDLERALAVEDLSRQAKEAGLNGTPFSNVKEALDAAKQAANTDDLIFIGGSTFVVAEII
ncbi:MAG: bifunctional folylpolyglutamate synthase/dihydrofolate synthase [Pedobacter sp.]|nr:MAG: bifunctional folylpolyglutamate synthase/dihydrofolate synthase [Pedobacter sp.]